MPIYEYKCERCNKVFEVRQKFADPPLTTHEECGGAVHRLLSAPAFQFKGSGWYVTDYGRSGGGRESGKKESSGESKTESNGSKSTTPETKSSGSDTSTKSDTK